MATNSQTKAQSALMHASEPANPRFADMVAILRHALARGYYQMVVASLTSPGWPLRYFGLGDERATALDLLFAHHAYREIADLCEPLISYPIVAATTAFVAALERQRLPFRFHLAAALEMLSNDERAVGVLVEAAAVARRLGETMAASRAMTAVARLLEQSV